MRTSGTMGLALVALVATVSMPRGLGAQGGVLVQGVVDLEAWATDTMSNLLRRNGGRPGGVIRLQLWSAVEPWRGIFLFGQGSAEGGNARAYEDRGTRVELEQAGLRLARDPRFVVNAGKLFHPIGVFAPRLFSTRNPLIGVPDTYTPKYPLGIMINGEGSRFDYKVGVVNLPPTHRDYVPEPDAYAQPVIGFGITPFTGLRIGTSATRGPYLNADHSATELGFAPWRQYRQAIITGDIAFGVGHFDLRGEYAHAAFDVPPYGSTIDGHAVYIEGRYTVTPRVFVATRVEENDYPFIRSRGDGTWTARRTKFQDLEVGAGFRFTESTLLKASYRVDDWTVTAQNANFVRPGGSAIAVQLSQSFDVMEMITRRRF